MVRNEREGLEGEIKKKKTWCCILRGNSMKEWETKRIKINLFGINVYRI